MAKQLVYLGQTQSGIKGLFTGNTLAAPLTEERWVRFCSDWEALEKYCERMGFTYDQNHDYGEEHEDSGD